MIVDSIYTTIWKLNDCDKSCGPCGEVVVDAEKIAMMRMRYYIVRIARYAKGLGAYKATTLSSLLPQLLCNLALMPQGGML